VGWTDIDEVCCGVLGVGTEEGKKGQGAAAASGFFLRGAGEAGAVGAGARNVLRARTAGRTEGEGRD
jgi:hypothetical protein